MKTALLIVLLVGLCVCSTGCLTAQQQARVNDLVAEERAEIGKLIAESIAAYKLVEDQTRDVKAKIGDGSLSVEDGKNYIELLRMELESAKEKIESQIESTKEAYGEQRDEILASGKSKVEIYGGILLAMALEFVGMNYYRNRKHPLTTPIT